MSLLTAISPPLARLISLPGVTDILVNGPNDIFIDRGVGLERVSGGFDSTEHLADVARRLIGLGQRHLDFANPCADVSLSSNQLEGVESVGQLRVHATLASAVSANTLLAVRVHRNELPTAEQLVARAFATERELTELQEIVESRSNFLICGPAGSGKTTLLRYLLSLSRDRVITIEDSAELGAINAHSVNLVTRQPNTEGRGEIDMPRLLRESLRMRPDRIVVGELRGAELMVYLQAMNTGHAGAATLHANSPEDVLPRLISIGQTHGVHANVVRDLAQVAVGRVIQLELVSSSARQVRRIASIA